MELKNRSQYLDKLISVQDMEVIKVVTGIRRCGKSSLLKLMMAHLREQGVMEEQILSMNFESMQFADMDSKRLYQYVMERAPKEKRLYLFLDEVQKVRDWQDAVNSFRVDLDCDIYVTGSNAYLLSSELSTYLSDAMWRLRCCRCPSASFWTSTAICWRSTNPQRHDKTARQGKRRRSV